MSTAQEYFTVVCPECKYRDERKADMSKAPPTCKNPSCKQKLSRPLIDYSGACAVTDSPELLFAASRHLPRKRLPDKVIRVGSEWAVPLSAFGTEEIDQKNAAETLKDWARKLGVSVRFDTGNKGPKVPVSELVQLRWVEPGRWSGSVDHHAAGVRYILGASTPQASRELFEGLLHHREHRIRARPLEIENLPPRNSGDTGFFCFWLVQGEPPLRLMKLADRVWREAYTQAEASGLEVDPYGHTEKLVNLFYELPYENDQTAFLQNVIWGNPGCYALLGPSKPAQIILQGTGSQSEFADITDFANLRLGAPTQPVIPTPADFGSLQLDIQVRFVERCDPRRAREDRLKNLEAEISAKEHLLESLRMHGPEVEYGSLREPLHIHYAPGEDVPNELERLMVEWSDQTSHLAGLQYTRVDARWFRNTAVPDGYVAHVLTTSRALTGQGCSDLDQRLHDYRPQGIPQAIFHLLPEWDRYGLRIFVPAAKSGMQFLELYPALRPSDSAAERFATALGIPAGQKSSCCVVLTGNAQGQVQSAILPIGRKTNAFRSLIDVTDWNCRLNVDFPVQELERIEDEAATHYLRAANRGLAEAAVNRLRPQVERLRERAGQAEEAQGRILSLQTDLRARFHELNHAVNQTQVELEAAGKEIAKSRRISTRLQQSATSFESLLNAYNTFHAELQVMLQELEK